MKEKDKKYILDLFPAIKKIRDGDLRQKVVCTWYNTWQKSSFRRIEDVHQFEPARDMINYTNVNHTNQVVTVCEGITPILADLLNLHINIDHLLAGAILHDIDKLIIFDAETANLTDTGKRFPHAVMGSILALMEGLPESVAHIIGAHSLKYSPVPPRSIEALIVRYVDHLVGESAYLAQGLNMVEILGG